MTEADIRQLIDSYIVDNQTYGITPAKMRDMMQQMVTYILEADGGGGGSTPTLQQVVDEDNTLTTEMLINAARILQSDMLGTYKTQMNPYTFALIISGVTAAVFGYTGGRAAMLLRDAGGFGSYFNSVYQPDALAAGVDNYLPLRSGRFVVEGNNIAPTFAPGLALGTVGTPGVGSFYGRSDDRGGQIFLQVGAAGPTPGETSVGVITLNQAYPVSVKVLLCPANASANSLTGGSKVYVIASNNLSIILGISSGGALSAGVAYNFRYFVFT